MLWTPTRNTAGRGEQGQGREVLGKKAEFKLDVQRHWGERAELIPSTRAGGHPLGCSGNVALGAVCWSMAAEPEAVAAAKSTLTHVLFPLDTRPSPATTPSAHPPWGLLPHALQCPSSPVSRPMPPNPSRPFLNTHLHPNLLPGSQAESPEGHEERKGPETGCSKSRTPTEVKLCRGIQ